MRRVDPDSACARVHRLLREPRSAHELSEACWDRVVRIARRAGLLGRLAAVLGDAGVEAPAPVERHLESERRIARAHHGNVRWEVRRVVEALGTAEVPFILLKGAAYVVGDLPPARGRLFEDVDILVPRDRLAAAESALTVHGWVTTHRHPYDQRYYREWMHELPPMRHTRRGSSLDVHHTLLPLTAPLHPDPARLWAAARPLERWPGAHLPGEADLVLHAAAHLFFDGAFENGLRDLLDLDQLLRHFGDEPGFWPALQDRAESMDLVRPAADALHWSQRWLDTPVPEPSRAWAARRRSRGLGGWTAASFAHGLQPDHPLCSAPGSALARALLYLRSHRLRMPWWRVVPHLVRKSLRRVEGDAAPGRP